MMGWDAGCDKNKDCRWGFNIFLIGRGGGMVLYQRFVSFVWEVGGEFSGCKRSCVCQIMNES